MTDRYDTYLQVRLTTHDKERIKARALEAGLKTSEYVREQALSEDHPAVPWKRERRGAFLERRMNELSDKGIAIAIGREQARGEWAAAKKLERDQYERNIRGSVGMQAPRNEP